MKHEVLQAAQTFSQTAKHRFRQFIAELVTHQLPLKEGSRILDFGCGAGGFLLEGVRRNLDVHGVEVDAKRLEQFRNASSMSHRNRFRLYNGGVLPLLRDTFDACYSWFVFEHVPNPGLSLREIVRVLKPGGSIYIAADDVRNCWDGHVNTPWPPYLPRSYSHPYLSAFGKSNRLEFINDTVFYISAPVVCDILVTLGCEIVYSNPPPRHPVATDFASFCQSEKEALALGCRMKELQEAGVLKPPVENLKVIAVKRK